MKSWIQVVFLAGLLLVPAAVSAQQETFEEQMETKEEQRKQKKKEAAEEEEPEPEEQEEVSASPFAGLELRSIGPALFSGRIGDLAVVPSDPDTWYVAVASGGVWKTTDHGTTFQPLFDSQGSYSIGCVTVDPNDPLTVWVGTGENNSQRSVGYGDGVYKSTDGGATWTNVGLEDSQHVGRILVDPRDSDVVWVAAQGPLWNAGGDRGLYKSTDGGETWTKSLEISDDTGVSDVVFDPRNPDVLYASAYQRRRRQWTLIDGGPESALYKSTDGGAHWTKLTSGLPDTHLGRIGLAVAPTAPDTVYAIVEAADDEGGFYRSTNGGASWEKRSDYVSGSPQYYQEIYVDPHDPERIYSMDTFMQVSEDGGETWRDAGEDAKHVDSHALWIDPEDPDHLLNGNDGGIYESWTRGANWHFYDNLPVTQFYKIAISHEAPFYWVYGGTQDNMTMGGPTATHFAHGISNRMWRSVLGGDGFEPAVDPENPDIVYAQWQYGNLTRYDRVSGEAVDVQPQPKPGEDPLRFNWDSPVLISPHSHTRIYFAAQKVFQSDDRGDHWRAISPDLTRGLDRNRLEIMGRVWSVDAVAKNASTSFYGNVVALAESPVAPGLLYAGTDDGLIQVTENGGETWRKVESFPGVPDMSYVDEIVASAHDADTVYAAFNHHKSGDFQPYVLKSTDRGNTWTSISGDLPERGSVYSLAEDPEMAGLLFAGTEFGLYVTRDGGQKWMELSGGLPTVAVRDLEIHAGEGDLVVGTFGRGIYVLDDYSPLRAASQEVLDQEAHLFDVPKAWMFHPASPLGFGATTFQGASFYSAPNPPFGALITYHLKEELKTRRAQRRDQEMEIAEEHGEVFYPSWEELREEDREEEPAMILTVEDEDGHVVRRLTGPVTEGFQRVAWDLRFPSSEPIRTSPLPDRPWFEDPVGPMVAPGTYRVRLAKRHLGVVTPLSETRTFQAEPVGLATLPAADREESLAFQRKVSRLQRAVMGAVRASEEAQTRIDLLGKAAMDTPAADPDLGYRLREVEERLQDLQIDLVGDRTVAARHEPTSPAVVDRVQRIVGGLWTTSSAPTGTQREGYDAAARAFGELLPKIREVIEDDLAALEQELEDAGAPWTPGRVPRWSPE